MVERLLGFLLIDSALSTFSVMIETIAAFRYGFIYSN